MLRGCMFGVSGGLGEKRRGREAEGRRDEMRVVAAAGRAS